MIAMGILFSMNQFANAHPDISALRVLLVGNVLRIVIVAPQAQIVKLATIDTFSMATSVNIARQTVLGAQMEVLAGCARMDILTIMAPVMLWPMELLQHLLTTAN